MNEPNKPAPAWWQTVPGVLTGVAALITALVGLLALLFQNGVIGSRAGSPSPSAPASPPEQGAPADPNQVQAGHLVYKVLDKELSQYAVNQKGKRIKSSLKVSLQITDVVGVSDYVDRNTIRLSAEGAEVFPENDINIAIYSKQSINVEAVFVIPANVTHLELLVGRQADSTAKIPISLK